MKRVLKQSSNDTLWFISYSDLISSILAVLIVIMSFSKLDIEKMDHVNRLMNDEKLVTLTELKKDYEKIILNNNLSELVNIKLDESGLLINTSSSVQFASNSALLDKEGIKKLSPIFQKIIEDSKKRNIFVVGHTDETGDVFHNWELSSQRANNVILYLISKGVNYKHLTLEAHASNKPYKRIESFFTRDEKVEARALNRRVTVIISQSYKKDK